MVLTETEHELNLRARIFVRVYVAQNVHRFILSVLVELS